jgi:hypothetical protein
MKGYVTANITVRPLIRFHAMFKLAPSSGYHSGELPMFQNRRKALMATIANKATLDGLETRRQMLLNIRPEEGNPAIRTVSHTYLAENRIVIWLVRSMSTAKDRCGDQS